MEQMARGLQPSEQEQSHDDPLYLLLRCRGPFPKPQMLVLIIGQFRIVSLTKRLLAFLDRPQRLLVSSGLALAGFSDGEERIRERFDVAGRQFNINVALSSQRCGCENRLPGYGDRTLNPIMDAYCSGAEDLPQSIDRERIGWR